MSLSFVILIPSEVTARELTGSSSHLQRVRNSMAYKIRDEQTKHVQSAPPAKYSINTLSIDEAAADVFVPGAEGVCRSASRRAFGYNEINDASQACVR